MESIHHRQQIGNKQPKMADVACDRSLQRAGLWLHATSNQPASQPASQSVASS
jgi:hypothetical protein